MAIAPSPAVRKSLLLLFLFLPLTLFAQSRMWGNRGISRRFVMVGTLVFDADGRGLSAYDTSDFANIERTAVALTDDESLDVAQSGDHQLALLTRGGINFYAFTDSGLLGLQSQIPLTGFTIVAGNGSLVAGASTNAISIWQPGTSSLDEIAHIPVTMAAVNAMAFHNGDLYVAVSGAGVSIYDPANAASPVGFMAENAFSLAFSGDTLFTASGVDGVAAFDVSNPAFPKEIGRLGAGEINVDTIAASNTNVYAGQAPSTLYFIDASTPAAMRTVFTSNEPVDVLAASGNRLYVAGAIVDAFGIANSTGVPLKVYVTGGTLLLSGQFTDLAGPVSGAATDGTLAYVADPPFFRVIDVSTTASPREIASLRVDDIQDHVRIDGKRAIIFGRGDVNVLDISNPYQPKLIATFVSAGHPPSVAALNGDLLLEGNPWSGFHVVDFTHYNPPAIVGSEKGHYFEVLTRGTLAYLLELDQLRIVDFSNLHADLPAAKFLGMNGTAAALADADATHPDLLVVHTVDGLNLYSLADLANPVLISSTPLAGSGVITTTPDTVFFANDGTITTIDISDPAHPVLTPTGMRVASPMQIAAASGKVVVADRYSLRVFGPNTAPPPPPPQPESERRRRVRH
jgi:hypothetical protein